MLFKLEIKLKQISGIHHHTYNFLMSACKNSNIRLKNCNYVDTGLQFELDNPFPLFIHYNFRIGSGDAWLDILPSIKILSGPKVIARKIDLLESKPETDDIEVIVRKYRNYKAVDNQVVLFQFIGDNHYDEVIVFKKGQAGRYDFDDHHYQNECLLHAGHMFLKGD